MKFFRNFQINALVTAIIYVAIGLLFILLPETVLRFVGVILAAALAIAGVVYIVDYFRKWDIEYRSNGLAIGILLIFGALFLLLQRDLVISILPLLLGLAVVVSGTIKLQNAIVLNRAKDRMWIATLVLAAICLILGMIIMLDPFATMAALIIMIGISLLVSGITDLVIIILMSRRSRELQAAKKGKARDTNGDA